MKRASYCMQKRTFVKKKSYQNNTTEFSQSLVIEYYGENEKATGMLALHDIEETFKESTRIVIVNTETNSETNIRTRKALRTWAENANMLASPKMIVRCYDESTDFKGNVYTYLDEYSWVDYANYKEGPMFILQICDVVSGKILEEKTYKSVGRLRNRIEKFIKTSTVDDGVITYNGQTCSVILNGIDISEYRMNAENIDLFLHTYGWQSTAIYRVTVEGLF